MKYSQNPPPKLIMKSLKHTQMFILCCCEAELQYNYSMCVVYALLYHYLAVEFCSGFSFFHHYNKNCFFFYLTLLLVQVGPSSLVQVLPPAVSVYFCTMNVLPFFLRVFNYVCGFYVCVTFQFVHLWLCACIVYVLYVVNVLENDGCLSSCWRIDLVSVPCMSVDV